MGFKEEIVGVSQFCPLNLPRVASTKINWEELLNLKPTCVFMLSSQKTKKGLKVLEKLNIKYGIYSFNSLRSIPFCAQDMARILGKEETGKKNFHKFMQKLKNLPKMKNFKVTYVLWWKPLIISTNSSYLAETLSFMGFDFFPKNEKKDFIKTSYEELFILKPDFVFFSEEAGEIPEIIKDNFKLIPLPSNQVNRPNLTFFEYFYNFKDEKLFH